MKFLFNYRGALFIAVLYVFGFVLVFIGVFVENSKPLIREFRPDRPSVLDERPEPPNLRD